MALLFLEALFGVDFIDHVFLSLDFDHVLRFLDFNSVLLLRLNFPTLVESLDNVVAPCF